MTEKEGEARKRELDRLYQHLDLVCQRMWKEDRASAVEVQAVAEEAKSELRHLERLAQTIEHRLMEESRAVRDEAQRLYDTKVSQLERQLSETTALNVVLQNSLANERQRFDTAFRELEGKEGDIAQFKEKYLKAEAQRDEARAKMMEDFTAEYDAKSKQLESHWAERLPGRDRELLRLGREIRIREDLYANLTRQAEEGRSKLHSLVSPIAVVAQSGEPGLQLLLGGRSREVSWGAGPGGHPPLGFG
ncbi:MAG: hypothetical protein HY748_16085 [Elusimicrobia bacterium]|nr:hypothetical protein [Elusimicrobiota bacterium]